MAVADDSSGRRVTRRGYAWTYVAVSALVLANYGLARAPLGVAALPVALAIATVQMVLVAMYFVHLVEERGTRRFALPVAIFFCLLLLALVFADVGDRYLPARPGGIPHEVKPRPAAAPQARTPDVTPVPVAP